MKNQSMTGEKETGSPYKAPSGQAQKKTFCRICEVHCGLRVDFDAEGAITSIRPDREHPVSQGYVCAKGTRFLEVANHPERLMHPLVRQPDGTYQQVSWKEALDYFKERIRPILKTFGPHAIAMYLGTPAIHNTLGALAYVGLARALGTIPNEAFARAGLAHRFGGVAGPASRPSPKSGRSACRAQRI